MTPIRIPLKVLMTLLKIYLLSPLTLQVGTSKTLLGLWRFRASRVLSSASPQHSATSEANLGELLPCNINVGH